MLVLALISFSWLHESLLSCSLHKIYITIGASDASSRASETVLSGPCTKTEVLESF